MSETEVVESTENKEVMSIATEESLYAYLNRDFSSENFKIEVKNLPRFYGFNVSNYYVSSFTFTYTVFSGVSEVT